MITVIGGVINSIQIKVTPPEKEGQDPNAAISLTEKDNIKVLNVGSGYNIAKHLAQKGCDVTFVSAIGDDALGMAAEADLKSVGVAVELTVVDGVTPVNVEMQNILGDVEMLRSNHQVLSAVTPQMVRECSAVKKAEIIVMDGSLPQETVEVVAKDFGKGAKIFYDPAGAVNGSKIASVLDEMYCVMPGRMEAENMTGMTILGQDQLMAAGRYLTEQGVNKVVLTMKGGGIYYKEGLLEGIQRPERVLSFAQTKGAGDVVSAAVIAAETAGKGVEEAVQDAMTEAAMFLADLSDERPY